DPLVTGVQTCALPISSVHPRDMAAIAPAGVSRRRRAWASARTASMVRRVTLSTRMSGVNHGFSPTELRRLRALGTPYGVQHFLEIGRASCRERRALRR